MFDPERLRNQFRELCEIGSASGSERAIADHVADQLRAAGIEVTEDNTAPLTGADAGNLLARLPGRQGENGPWLMFCAHLDTVPHEGPIEVTQEGDAFRSAGDTILGADNKAAVAVLLELICGWAQAEGQASLLTEAGPPAGIELLLTMSEETGLRGARHFDLSALRAEEGFVIDHASPVGEIITASPTHLGFKAKFTGLEAHAGIRPEAGRSAIKAAAAAIDALPLGRIDSDTTANVGRIYGGGAGNVVPATCEIDGEVRGLDSERAHEILTRIAETSADHATAAGCDVAFISEQVFAAYSVPSNDPLVEMASDAITRCGIDPAEVKSGGGSDANALWERGFRCLLLADGTRHNHTAQESIDGESLDRMLEICDTLLAVRAERSDRLEEQC